MVAAAFGGRHHVVIHYVITYFFFGVGPVMFVRLWPLLFFRLWPRHVFSAFGPCCIFNLLFYRLPCIGAFKGGFVGKLSMQSHFLLLR